MSEATTTIAASTGVYKHKKPLHRTSSRRKLNAMRSEEEKLYRYKDKNTDRNQKTHASITSKMELDYINIEMGTFTSSNFPNGNSPGSSSIEFTSFQEKNKKKEPKAKNPYPYDKTGGIKKKKKQKRKKRNYSCKLLFVDQSIYHYRFEKPSDNSSRETSKDMNIPTNNLKQDIRQNNDEETTLSYDQQVASGFTEKKVVKETPIEERSSDNQNAGKDDKKKRLKPPKLQQRYWVCDGYWRNYPSSELQGPIFLYLGNANDHELEKDMNIHNEYVKFYEDLKANFKPAESSQR